MFMFRNCAHTTHAPPPFFFLIFKGGSVEIGNMLLKVDGTIESDQIKQLVNGLTNVQALMVGLTRNLTAANAKIDVLSGENVNMQSNLAGLKSRVNDLENDALVAPRTTIATTTTTTTTTCPALDMNLVLPDSMVNMLPSEIVWTVANGTISGLGFTEANARCSNVTVAVSMWAGGAEGSDSRCNGGEKRGGGGAHISFTLTIDSSVDSTYTFTAGAAGQDSVVTLLRPGPFEDVTEELARAGAGTTGTVTSTHKSGGPRGISQTFSGAETGSMGGVASTTSVAGLIDNVIETPGNADGTPHTHNGRTAGAGGYPDSSIEDSKWSGMPGVISYHCSITPSVNGAASPGVITLGDISGSGRRQARFNAEHRAQPAQKRIVEETPLGGGKTSMPLILNRTTCFTGHKGNGSRIFHRSPTGVSSFNEDGLYSDGYTVISFLPELLPPLMGVRGSLLEMEAEFEPTTLNAGDVPGSSDGDNVTFSGDTGRKRMCLSRVKTPDAGSVMSWVQDFAHSVGSEALPGVVIRRDSGCDAQVWHRDGERHGYALVLALQDSYNMTVCPATHMVQDHIQLRAPHCMPLQLRAGQALLFDQLMLHGGGVNRESREQFGLHIYLQDLTSLEREGLVGYVQRRSWSQQMGLQPC